MITQMLNVNVLVRSVEKALETYVDRLGLPPPKQIETISGAGVKVAYLPVGQGVTLDLMQPIVADSPETRFLERRGEGLYLITFGLTDFDRDIAALRSKGVDIPRASGEAEASRNAFVLPKAAHGVLIRLTPAS